MALAIPCSQACWGSIVLMKFLFQSKQGFCEHYASSFVMLMRYAGIPARIVVGYQGGQPSPDAKSWEVRQLDAHAWTGSLCGWALETL